MSRKLAALLVAITLITGGLYDGTKEDQIQREATTYERLSTALKGGTAAIGPNRGINGGFTGSPIRRSALQGGLESGEANKQPVLGLILYTPTPEQTASRSGNNISRVYSNTGSYVSLGVYKITAYTAGYESTGKRPGDKGYGEVAISGSKRANFEPVYVEEGVTIAADWGVLPPGTKVYIEGVGTRTVQDKGGAVKGNHIDLFIEDLGKAQEWGVQRLEVYLVK